MLHVHRRLGPESDIVKTARIIQCTAYICTLCVVSHSCMVSGSGYSWNWDIDLFLVLQYWDIEWRWHLLKKSRCWDVSLTSSRHRWLKCVNSHQALRWTQQCRDSRKPWERWASRCRNRAQKTWESVSQRRTHLAKTSATGTSRSMDTRVRSTLPIRPCWTQRENHQQWWWRLHHTNSSPQACCTFSRCSQRKEHGKSWGKHGNNGFEAYRHLCLMYGTSAQEGSTRLFVQTMTYKLGSKIEDMEDRLNEFLELVTRYDEANGTDRVPD